jgi:hypothetical protein
MNESVIVGLLLIGGGIAAEAGNVSVLTSPKRRIRASIEMPGAG